MALRFACGHCGTTAKFKVNSSHIDQWSSSGWRVYCFTVCDSCNKASLASFSMNSEWAHKLKGYENDRTVHNLSELPDVEIYPDGQIRAPEHLPELVEQTYHDAEFNLLACRWKAAANLYLQTVELSCIHLKADGTAEAARSESAAKIDLTRRINGLWEDGKITQDLKVWAHNIRVLGQYHKHRYVEANEEDAETMRNFCRLFLQYVFTMPGMIAKLNKPL